MQTWCVSGPDAISAVFLIPLRPQRRLRVLQGAWQASRRNYQTRVLSGFMSGSAMQCSTSDWSSRGREVLPSGSSLGQRCCSARSSVFFFFYYAAQSFVNSTFNEAAWAIGNQILIRGAKGVWIGGVGEGGLCWEF